MKKMTLANSVRNLLAGAVLALLLPALPALSQEADMSALFDSLREQGGSAEDVITGLMDNGFPLDNIAAYSVANADSIGLAIAYAQAAVCLAPDQPTAQAVGQTAVDTADEAARNAVQAGVATALASYAAGECQAILDQLNTASQAFTAPEGGEGSAPPAGGGTPPEVDIDDPPASESN